MTVGHPVTASAARPPAGVDEGSKTSMGNAPVPASSDPIPAAAGDVPPSHLVLRPFVRGGQAYQRGQRVDARAWRPNHRPGQPSRYSLELDGALARLSDLSPAMLARFVEPAQPAQTAPAAVDVEALIAAELAPLREALERAGFRDSTVAVLAESLTPSLRSIHAQWRAAVGAEAAAIARGHARRVKVVEQLVAATVRHRAQMRRRGANVSFAEAASLVACRFISRFDVVHRRRAERRK